LSIRSLPPEAVPYEEKSLAAAGEAVKLEPEKLASHSALAASLMRLGGERRADGLAEYRWVLEAARGKQRLEYSDLLSAGWAAFRLASHEAMDTMSLLAEAERLNVEALAIKKDRPTSSDAIEVRFNLALTLLCSKRFGLALNEYDDILRLVREKQPRVARGLLGRARTDIEQSLAEWPQLNGVSHAKRALESLKKGYSEAQQRLMAELEGIQFPSSTLPHSAAAAAGL
jgi:tetratricopeptide (TPR) repeat protein